MTITNGQDRSAASKRERGRQSFEPDFGNPPLPVPNLEGSGPKIPQSAGSARARAIAERAFARPEGLLLEPQRAWLNVQHFIQCAVERSEKARRHFRRPG